MSILNKIRVSFDLFGMHILFLISGYVTKSYLERNSISNFLISRIKKLLYPILIGIFIINPFTLYMLYKVINNLSISFLDYIPIYLTLNINSLNGINGTFSPLHLWFILYLFLYSLLIILIKSMPKIKYINFNNTNIKNHYIITLLFFPLLYIINLLGLNYPNFFLFFFYYLFGYYLSNSKKSTLSKKIIFIYSLILFLIVLLYNLNLFNLHELYLSWISFLIVILVFNIFRMYFNKKNRILSYFTNISYYSYIIHLFFIILFSSILIRYNLNYYVLYISIFSLTFVSIYFSHNILKKYF
jgi:glucan biosynthesis protein C